MGSAGGSQVVHWSSPGTTPEVTTGVHGDFVDLLEGPVTSIINVETCNLVLDIRDTSTIDICYHI